MPRMTAARFRMEKEGSEELVSIEEFEKRTGAAFIPGLDFESASIWADARKRGARLYRKGEMTREQLWFGSLFRREIETYFLPDVAIRWIDPSLGWGVFADRDFQKMDFIAEYAGKVRRRKKSDAANAYCFEFVLAEGFPTPYVIDAQDQSGIGRLINHSSTPNLLSALATFDAISHVILYAKDFIPKGAQLCFDYGPDYWSRRKPPVSL